MSNSKSDLNLAPDRTQGNEVALPLTEYPSELPSAAPFVKWAGGKRSVIDQLAPHFPEQIARYWEPFLGGGAVFFAFHDRIEQAILSDANEELVIAFHVVKTNVEALILRLRAHAMEHQQDKTYFTAVRKQKLRSDIEIAARFIYLNKTCFNGLYRVNKQGQFNVPKGDYKNPNICDEPRLRAANRALEIAKIRVGDFANVVKPGSDDFIYCDPTYDECFSNYQSGGFDNVDQQRLKKTADMWMKEGGRVIISNSRTPLIDKLYRGTKYTKETINAHRYISSDASTRGATPELVISGNAKKQ